MLFVNERYRNAKYKLGDASGDSRITVCDDGSYYCGQSNSACCNAGAGYFIVNGLAVLKFVGLSPSGLFID
jgi:hypothetical protein